MPSHGDELSSRHDAVVIGAGPANVLRAMRLASRAHRT
jgi:pyruvate/2-oxoglutarate dehydrogenase complex dihydrolipoamide dehydrogenase (E3) component